MTRKKMCISTSTQPQPHSALEVHRPVDVHLVLLQQPHHLRVPLRPTRQDERVRPQQAPTRDLGPAVGATEFMADKLGGPQTRSMVAPQNEKREKEGREKDILSCTFFWCMLSTVNHSWYGLGGGGSTTKSAAVVFSAGGLGLHHPLHVQPQPRQELSNTLHTRHAVLRDRRAALEDPRPSDCFAISAPPVEPITTVGAARMVLWGGGGCTGRPGRWVESPPLLRTRDGVGPHPPTARFPPSQWEVLPTE